jgi:type IV pilus assembly protein PilC
MLFSPRMPIKQLVASSQRMSMGLLAGVDIRKICDIEVRSTRGLSAQGRLRTISETVNQGGSLSDGLAATGDYFPPLFREMVGVGEQSGRLGEVLRQLSGHYQNQLSLRRVFLGMIAWPAIELTLALCVVGFLIWVMGIINGSNNKSPIDPLGMGLIGNDGLVKYVAFIATVGIVVALLVRAMSRGMLWTRPLQRLLLRLPKIGPALQAVALARLTWVLSQTMNTTMEVRKSLRLALQSTRNAWYIDRIEPMNAEISKGSSIYEAFIEAGGFPQDFLATLYAGEQSGSLAETMAHMANGYQEQARASLRIMATFAGLAVWVIVAAIIIFAIFRLAMFYIGSINAALNG